MPQIDACNCPGCKHERMIMPWICSSFYYSILKKELPDIDLTYDIENQVMEQLNADSR